MIGFCSNQKHIFAIGDAVRRQQFTHISRLSYAGIIIRNMLFKLPARISDKAVPWVTYTDPELAHVGLGEDEAIAQYGERNITILNGRCQRMIEPEQSGAQKGLSALLQPKKASY